MTTAQLYNCLSDNLRLRLLNLLHDGALCERHFLEILDESPPKLYEALQYLKNLELVTVKHYKNWQIYSLSQPLPTLLTTNLLYLRSHLLEHPHFAQDLNKRIYLLQRLAKEPGDCPPEIYQPSGAGFEH